MKKILIVLVVVLILAAAGVLLWQNFGEQTPEPVFCAADAKLCFDGSYVSRVAPSCEFVSCPTPSDWKTSSAGGVEFKYPEILTAKYISVSEWPPKAVVKTGEFSCAETPATESFPARVARRMVDDRVYCVAAMSEGAAGSTYTTYTYTTARAGKLISLNFVLRYPQCLNYDDPKQSECAAEREAFDLDGVIDRIVGTMVIE
jgi:hypothetical protein